VSSRRKDGKDGAICFAKAVAGLLALWFKNHLILEHGNRAKLSPKSQPLAEMASEWFLERLEAVALARSRASMAVPEGCIARALQLADSSGHVPRSPAVAEPHAYDTRVFSAM